MVSERVQIGVMCGERWAENLLYRRYYSAALSFAKNIVPNRADAEEIASQAMFEAMRDITQYSANRGKFITWLFAIIKNTARDRHKVRRNRYGQ